METSINVTVDDLIVWKVWFESQNAARREMTVLYVCITEAASVNGYRNKQGSIRRSWVTLQ
jgi:hypothetical protein